MGHDYQIVWDLASYYDSSGWVVLTDYQAGTK
jgi:hypothetical protein